MIAEKAPWARYHRHEDILQSYSQKNKKTKEQPNIIIYFFKEKIQIQVYVETQPVYITQGLTALLQYDHDKQRWQWSSCATEEMYSSTSEPMGIDEDIHCILDYICLPVCKSRKIQSTESVGWHRISPLVIWAPATKWPPESILGQLCTDVEIYPCLWQCHRKPFNP